jgi:hypothetical protein
MNNLLVDRRDQEFILNEMLGIDTLFDTSLYGHLTKKTMDMSLDAAAELAAKEFYPTIMEADSQGCRLENNVRFIPAKKKILKTAGIRKLGFSFSCE